MGGGPAERAVLDVVEDVLVLLLLASSAGEREDDGRVDSSMLPKQAEASRFSSSVPGGWTGSYASVASLPASWRMILEPPGCSERKDVTWSLKSGVSCRVLLNVRGISSGGAYIIDFAV